MAKASPNYTHADPTVAGGDFNVRDVIRDLSKLSAALKGEIADAIRVETATVQADAVRRATWPGTTGKYRAAIRSKTFDDANRYSGKVFVVQGEWHRDVRRASGRVRLWPKNLPIWLEYGTVQSSAKPHLIPAFEAGKRRLSEKVTRILERAARA
jgi:hypothetical protein